MTPELNFAEIGHGRGTNDGMDLLRRYGGDGMRDSDDEDLVIVNAGSHTPLTPPSGYGSTSVVTPTPRRGYGVGDVPQGDGSGTDERQAYFQNPYRHQMERDHGRHQPRPRARGVDQGTGSSTSPQIRALQESVHQALGGVPPDSLSDGGNTSAGGRGRSERKGWRNRLTAAEHYASSLLFGRGGNGGGGPGSGAGSSSQVLHEHDD
jgi:F-box and leucine-rich repeat protein GRR1